MKNIFNISINTKPITYGQRKIKTKRSLKNPLNWIFYLVNESIYVKSFKDVIMPQSMYLFGGSSTFGLFNQAYINSMSQKEPIIVIDPGVIPIIVPKNDSIPCAIIGENCKVNFFDNLLDNHLFKKVYFYSLKSEFSEYDTITQEIEDYLIEKRKIGSVTTKEIQEAIDKFVINENLRASLNSDLYHFANLEANCYIGGDALELESLIENNFNIFFKLNSNSKTIIPFTKWVDEILMLRKNQDYRIFSYVWMNKVEEQYDLKNIKSKHVVGLMCSEVNASFLPPNTDVLISPNGSEPSEYIKAIYEYFPQINQEELNKALSFCRINSPIYLKKDDKKIDTILRPYWSQKDFSHKKEEIQKNYQKYLYKLVAYKEKIYLESQLSSINHVIKEPKKIKNRQKI